MDMWMDVDTALSEVPVNMMPLLDATDFKTIEDAVAYNAAGLSLFWHFVTTAGAYTVTAVTPTTGGTYDWTDQGSAGVYTIEIPASGGASINNDTEGFGWFTGVATGVLPWRGPVIGFRDAALNNALIDNAWSTTRGLAGTALPNAAADAAGGLPISDAGGLDLDAQVGTKINDILTDTGTTLDARIPAALVSGRMDASVGAMAANVVTATAIAADAITDAKVASDVTIASVTGAVGSVTGAVGSVTGNVGGNVTGSVGSVATGGISAASFAAGAIDAAAIASNAIGASELAADAASEIATAVRTELATELARVDAAVTTRATPAQVNTEVDTALADIHLDHLLAATYDPASKPGAADALLNELVENDGGVARYTANALELAPTGGSAPTVGQIADEVQTRTIAAVTTVNGLAANTVTAAALAADAVTEIQSGLATAAALATVDGIVDDILVDTAEIGAAGAGLTALASAANLATAAGYIDTEVAAIKAKTDNLPSDPADQSAVEAAITAATSPLATAANLATVAGYLDTEIASIISTLGVAGAGLTEAGGTGDHLTALALSSSGIDAVMDETIGDSTITVRQALRLTVAALVGKLSGAATSSVVVRNVADDTNRITATVDADGNRSAVTLSL